MKKTTSFLLLIVSFIVCVILYLRYDDKGYNYGLGCNFCNKTMLNKLVPKYNSHYPQNFVLLDEDGFELVGKGFRYETTNFKIKDFLAYGYNDTSVLVKCTDSLNTIKYLVSYETGYKSKKGNLEISFKDLNNKDFEQVKDKYQWFEIDEEKENTVSFMKFIFMIGALLSLSMLLIKLFKLRKAKATY